MNKSNCCLVRLGLILAFCCAAGTSFSAQVQAVGPVNKSDDRASISVLGQTFVIPAGARRPLLGSFVAVAGELRDDGILIAKSIKVLTEPYVPGASHVFLHGRLNSLFDSVGVVHIGDAQVQLSQAIGSFFGPFAVGDTIEIVGIQPIPGGTIWASSMVIVSEEPLRSEIISQAIQGTGALAIQGTGKQAIQGTGTAAIQGTGKQAIQGTGALAIQGTGKQAIQGTGAFAIQGTGQN